MATQLEYVKNYVLVNGCITRANNIQSDLSYYFQSFMFLDPMSVALQKFHKIFCHVKMFTTTMEMDIMMFSISKILYIDVLSLMFPRVPKIRSFKFHAGETACGI